MLGFAIGHAVSYLTNAVVKGREGYYVNAVVETGEPAGLWYGAGAEALGLTGEVDAETMTAVYESFLDPTDPASRDRATWGEARTLGNAARKYRTPDAIYQDMIAKEPMATPERRSALLAEAELRSRQSVAFYDMTFSPSKSVTVLAAAFERSANDARRAGDEQAAEAWSAMHKAVEAAVMAGARASVDFLQDEGGYVRDGHHGGNAGKWADAHTLVVAQFLQHDSREKDPQLHVHQAILNKALTKDGRWLAVDGVALKALRGAAGAIGERVMEAELSRVLGLRWETRPDGHGREIVGVDRRVRDLFSSRRRQVSDRVREVVREWTGFHGREPNALELTRISQEAALSTRKAKSHTAEDPAARLERWERECREKLAGGLAQVAREALRARVGEPERWSPTQIIERAVAHVAEKRQTWTRGDLIRSASDVLPANLGLPAEQVRALLESVADRALDGTLRVTPEERTDDMPAEMLLASGASPFARPCGAKFTAKSTVAAEHTLRGAAIERGAVALPAEEADAAVDRFAELGGVELGADQKAAVRGVLTSGARLELIQAGAGAGKSFTVKAISDGWTAGGRNLYCLATSQSAADLLGKEGLPAWNTTRWLGGGQDIPGLAEGDIVVVDEAGMASTSDLAAIWERCRAAGAKLLLVGDARQLAAVGAGGVFADLASRSIPYELTEIRRFREEWEREASLRLRAGDTVAVEDYDRHGRIRAAGTQEQAAAAAARAWLADTVEGLDALLIVGSNEDAGQVSAQLRSELIRLGRVSADGGVQMGWDGNTASVGDVVHARHNGWKLAGWEGNRWAPINQQRYRVTALRADGGLTVVPVAGGETLQLPASYVTEHLSLGYAATVHSAQGRTVDAAHPVVTPGMDAGALYSALTRGRLKNVAWVVSRKTDQTAPVGSAQDVEHRAAKAVIVDILAGSEEERSALREQDEAQQRAESVATAIERLAEQAAQATAGRASGLLDLATATGEITEGQRAALAADPAMGGLERVLRQAEVAGHDPAGVLSRALQGEWPDDPRSPAALMSYRIRETFDLAPKLQSAADLVPRGLPERWHRYLSRLAEDADNRRRELGSRIAESLPQWAREALGAPPADSVAREEWEHRAGWAAAAREAVGHEDEADPLGPAPAAGLAEKHAIWRTAHVELDLPDRSPEESKMSLGRLLNRVAAWDRERKWAPRYVADELSATSERWAQRRDDARLWAERAEHEELPEEEREQLRTAAEEAWREAEDLEGRVRLLEQADRDRSRWMLRTAGTRDRSERATAEVAARGADLINPRDVVSSKEWLAAEAADRLSGDAHRPIHEVDLADELVDDAPPVLEVAVETAVPDIREIAVPDAAEFSDDGPGRRVPAADEAVATVERARVALLEDAARAEADAVREAEDEALMVATTPARAGDAAAVLVMGG